MWTGYSFKRNKEVQKDAIQYPRFIFIEHSDDTEAAEIFAKYFGHHPYEHGRSIWHSEHNKDLMPLLGGLIDCSDDYSDSSDTFKLSHTYFFDEGCYVDDMKKLNAFIQEEEVLILSEMNVHK